MKKIIVLMMSFLLMFSLAACGKSEVNAGGSEKKEPLKVTLPTWTGYGPLFLAKEKGFFKKHGVGVELTIIEGLAERKQALAGGDVDGMATAMDVQATLAAAGIPMQIVWLLDDSYGGDGILVKNNIKSVEDLKGKQVGFSVGSTSHLLLLTALQEAGLTDEDITAVPMSAGEAGAAFAAGKLDAAVTWEPWLSKGASANGKVLLTTKDLPGIIVDTVGFKQDVIEKRPEDVKGFVAAMAEAMDYWKENEKESNKIMAKGLNIDLAEFEGTVTGLKFFDLEANKELFGTKDAKGKIYESMDAAINFYAEKDLIDKKPAVDATFDANFVEGL